MELSGGGRYSDSRYSDNRFSNIYKWECNGLGLGLELGLGIGLALRLGLRLQLGLELVLGTVEIGSVVIGTCTRNCLPAEPHHFSRADVHISTWVIHKTVL